MRTNAHTPEDSMVKFNLVSPDGEMGFPGTLHINVTHELTEDNEWVLTYEGEADAHSVLAMTNHVYFNLNANVDNVRYLPSPHPSISFLFRCCSWLAKTTFRRKRTHARTHACTHTHTHTHNSSDRVIHRASADANRARAHFRDQSQQVFTSRLDADSDRCDRLCVQPSQRVSRLSRKGQEDRR